MFKAFSPDKQSLNDHCFSLLKAYNIELTKQSLDAKFTTNAVDFIKSLLSVQLEKMFTHETHSVSGIRNIIIQDSTKFGLPDKFQKDYKGFGGRSCSAGGQLQFSYNLTTHKVNKIELSSASKPDRTYAKDNHVVKEGDLIIRDLGYFSLEGFHDIENRNAYYLSRVFPRTSLFERHGNKWIRIDIEQLVKKMHKHNIPLLEKEVFIGLQNKVRTKIIIQFLPEFVKEERLRNKKKRAKENGKKMKTITRTIHNHNNDNESC